MLPEEGVRQRMRRMRIISLASIVLVFLCWYLVTTESWSHRSNCPVRSALDTLVQVRSTILRHALVTFYRVSFSFLAGSALGVLVGLVMSRFRVVFALLEPVLESLRPIPPIESSGSVSACSGGLAGRSLRHGKYQVRNVPRIYIQAARALGAEQDHIYRTVILPAIVPELIAGLRVALALAFGLMIAAELMGAQEGIGFMIMVARRSLIHRPSCWASSSGIEAALADRLLYYFTRRLTRWTERDVER